MIAIVADSPSLGAGYRLKDAFAPFDECRVIYRQPDSYRGWPVDLIVSDENRAECRSVAELSRWLLVIGRSGLDVLKSLYADCDLGDTMIQAYLPPMVAYQVESFYRDDVEHHSINQEWARWPVAAHYAMPDLLPLAPIGTVPLLQPMQVPAVVPQKEWPPLIVHSPGTEKKRVQKGSLTIARAIHALHSHVPAGAERPLPFVYEEILGRPHEYVLARKETAAIVIDQVPDPGLPYGVANSGLEGLAAGCVVLSAMYPENDLNSGYFERPPVLPVYSEREVFETLLLLLTSTPERLGLQQCRGWDWVRRHLALRPWLDYFVKYLPRSLGGEQDG